MTTSRAHPNIALIKYWGKQDKPGNIPATPNISITLDNLVTETKVINHHEDEFWLDGKKTADNKVMRFVAALRNQFDIPPLKITSTNNFPTSAGLASSASGFAALITAINAHAQLGLNPEMCSEWARHGSASAARSIFGGYVALVPPLWRAQAYATAQHWPLETIVAITSTAAKTISSTKGMTYSKNTSPFYKTWVRSSAEDFATASDAISQRDFAGLAAIAELSCLKMHSVMLTSTPTLAYWNQTTLACMELIRDMRRDGIEVFFTIDAGPQIKAICIPTHAPIVAAKLTAVPGVVKTIHCLMGPDAHVVSS